MDTINNVESYLNKNYAHVVGEVVKEVTPSHLFSDKMYYFLKVEVRNNSKKTDIIQAFVSEDMIINNDHIIDIGDTVDFSGYLVYTKIEGRSDTAILVTTINIVDSTCNHCNSVYLEGEILKSYELKSLKNGKYLKNMIIRHESLIHEGMYFNIKVIARNSLAQKIDNDYNEGDSIILKGKFRSKKVTSDRNKVIYLHEISANILINKDSSE